MRKAFLTLSLLAFAGSTSLGGLDTTGLLGPPQGVDQEFNPHVLRPAYSNRHPKVLFDAAHNNADTPSGRYKPFADLISSDGYRVVANLQVFSKRVLSGYDVLIIVNASGPQEQRAAPAFTAEECDVVYSWVKSGGALLLISDHAPFSSAISELCRTFGVDITKGFTIETVHYNKDSNDQTEIVFDRENGLLLEHAITLGRDATERTNRIITFSGTSLKGPPESLAFLKLADTAMDVLPPEAKQTSPDEAPPDYKQVSAAGRAQGLAFGLGKGRVVVLGEAAMLTAQVASRGFRFGMNVSGIDNRKLAVNIMHWLSRLLR
jgi:hypothetical protein